MFKSALLLVASVFAKGIPVELSSCAPEGFENTYVLHSLIMEPYPILIGGNVIGSINSTFKNPITDGGYVSIAIEYLYATITQKVPICTLKGVECPFAGDLLEAFSTPTIPEEVEAGSYPAEIKVINGDGTVEGCYNTSFVLV